MITVLMPAYNAAATIVPAIRSVLASTFTEFELLVVDDGSTDKTPDLVNSVKDPRVRIVYHPENRGLSEALNTGLKAASYPVIMRMDADDITTPLRMQKQYELIKNNSRLIVATDYAAFNRGGIQFCIKNPSSSEEIKKRLPLHSSLLHSSMMYHKELILSEGGYRNVPLEDYELLLRIHSKAEFYCIPEVLHFMRLRSGSLTSDSLYAPFGAAYRLQQHYYNRQLSSFGFTDANQENLIRGWREFFYGKASEARRYWSKVPFKDLDKRLLIATAVTFLPLPLRQKIKNLRMRQRLELVLGKNMNNLDELNAFLREYL